MGLREAKEQKALMDEKARLKQHLKEAGITTYDKAMVDLYWPILLGVAGNYNGNHADALKGAMSGLNTATARMKSQGDHSTYSTLEAGLCAAVAVEHPERLCQLLEAMAETQITNSNAARIARKTGVEDCLPAYLRNGRG